METKMLCVGVISPEGGWVKTRRWGRVVTLRVGPHAKRGLLERMVAGLKWSVLVGFLLTLYFQLGHMLISQAAGQ